MTFKDALRTKDFVVTAHVTLPRAPDAESVIRQGEILRPAVDAVQLTDNPVAQVHMSGIAAAALLLQQGIDPIVHMTCRDRNRIALQSDFIGAVALGVTSILVMRGKKIPDSKKLKVRNVFDAPAKELMAFIRNLKDAEIDWLASDFLVGAAAELFDPDADWTPDNLTGKCDAGANFVQLQICFDMGVVRNYMARIVASKLTHRLNFIMALSPLPSADVAHWMRDNMKGALIPESIIKRMEQASDPEHEGIEICAELLQELATIPGVSGANLLTLGNLETIPAAIDASGVRPS
ncbi:MAG: methylenetetrahydrofolate reductase [Proteobacteria bacterium]|nr:methylenetetrahydrofolate reductase [Pseudomonadota bacterium]